MISSLTGTVDHVGLNQGVISVSGMGMLFHATPHTLATLRLGETGTVQTSLVVREDSLTLYGFASVEEREVFEALLGVSGIGPRLALAVLAVHSPEAVRVAASAGDDKAFTQVPGIGPKGARRMILELADKLVPTGIDESGAGPAAAALASAAWTDQVLEALTGLGWSEKDAEKAVSSTLAHQPDLEESGDVGSVLRATLRHLGQGQSTRSGGSR